MDGVVCVAGVFGAGSVVTLIQVPDERVLRPEGHEVIGQRIVDDAGNVGFDGLEVGGRYFVTGYVNGTYTLCRCLGVEAGAPDSELAQPPIQPTPQSIGTQEAKDVVVPPALPDGAADLATGVPPAADPANPSTTPEADEPGEHELPADEVEPVQSDALPQGAGTTPSESAGVGDQAGSPSEDQGAPSVEAAAQVPQGTSGAVWTTVPPVDPTVTASEPVSSSPAGPGLPTSDATASPSDPSTPQATDGATPVAGSPTDGAPLTDPSAPPASDPAPAPAGGDTSPVA